MDSRTDVRIDCQVDRWMDFQIDAGNERKLLWMDKFLVVFHSNRCLGNMQVVKRLGTSELQR